jgi:hypothetical protein
MDKTNCHHTQSLQRQSNAPLEKMQNCNHPFDITMFFVNNTIRLPGNPRGQGCRTVSFIQEISPRSLFVTLEFAYDICMQIKPNDIISANQHGIWSTKVSLRPRVISKALQICNFKTASLLVVKMSHFVAHLKLFIHKLDMGRIFLTPTRPTS